MKNKKLLKPETICVVLEKDQVHRLETLAYKMSVAEHRRVGISELTRIALDKIYPETGVGHDASL